MRGRTRRRALLLPITVTVAVAVNLARRWDGKRECARSRRGGWVENVVVDVGEEVGGEGVEGRRDDGGHGDGSGGTQKWWRRWSGRDRQS